MPFRAWISRLGDRFRGKPAHTKEKIKLPEKVRLSEGGVETFQNMTLNGLSDALAARGHVIGFEENYGRFTRTNFPKLVASINPQNDLKLVTKLTIDGKNLFIYQ